MLAPDTPNIPLTEFPCVMTRATPSPSNKFPKFPSDALDCTSASGYTMCMKTTTTDASPTRTRAEQLEELCEGLSIDDVAAALRAYREMVEMLAG